MMKSELNEESEWVLNVQYRFSKALSSQNSLNFYDISKIQLKTIVELKGVKLWYKVMKVQHLENNEKAFIGLQFPLSLFCSVH